MVQDIALSRRKQGFKSPRERHARTPRAADRQARLVIAISSRALFDLDESHRVFEDSGLERYRDYQVEKEDSPLKPGRAFHLARKLQAVNELMPGRVEIILLSRNTADTGLRVFNSIEHHRLGISRAAFCGGFSPHRYVAAFGIHLFLSNLAEDVRRALREGVAAATLLGSSPQRTADDDREIRFAFDGDAVLFSDQAERVYQSEGLEAFAESERRAANRPLDGGPFKPFLTELHRLQQEFDRDRCPIRTALFTARAAPAHKRVIKTLRHWNIRLDEALFLGGQSKREFLEAYGADVFFDDQQCHCDAAGVTAAHVPHGIANR